MIRHSRIARPFVVSLVGAVVGAFVLATDTNLRAVNDTIWVANRLASVSSIREFDAATGDVVRTVTMAPNSQPGDLAYAKGKIYVAEEFGNPPAVAVIDAETGGIITRIPFPNQPPFTASTGWRPHHVHASVGGTLVAVGLFGTDMVAVIDTRDDSLLGPWDSNPDTINGRVHAAVFSKDGNTLYLANEGANEVDAIDPYTGFVFWRMPVPARCTNSWSRTTANVPIVSRRGDEQGRPHRSREPDTLKDCAHARAARHDAVVGQRKAADDRSSDLTGAAGGRQHRRLQLRARQSGRIGHDGRPSMDVAKWPTSRSRRLKEGRHPGVAVIDHRDGNKVIDTLPYAGRPHGVTRALP